MKMGAGCVGAKVFPLKDVSNFEGVEGISGRLREGSDAGRAAGNGGFQ